MAGYGLAAGNVADGQSEMADDELLLAERHAALREAFAHLPPRGQQLIALLLEDPPVPYTKIGARLGIPAASIGPSRGRCLDKLRRYPAIAVLINTEAKTMGPEIHGQAVPAMITISNGCTPRRVPELCHRC